MFVITRKYLQLHLITQRFPPGTCVFIKDRVLYFFHPVNPVHPVH